MKEYQVELKSVNHKYSDINVKLPRFLNSIEGEIRKKVANSISNSLGIQCFVCRELILADRCPQILCPK